MYAKKFIFKKKVIISIIIAIISIVILIFTTKVIMHYTSIQKISSDEEIKNKEIISNSDDKFNFLLEGDNLHSLYLLEKTHKGKIDVIYIDPPYNTGNRDFIYDDNCIDSEDCYKHSKWLSFMKRRLEIANKLLSINGVIFISIDDNEFAQLKLLCDEIFGENDFVTSIHWKRSESQNNSAKQLAIVGEYILCYAKCKFQRLFNKIELKNTALKEYRYVDEITGKKFRRGTIVDNTRGKNILEVTSPNGITKTIKSIRNKTFFDEKNKKGEIYWTETGTPYLKIFLKDSEGQVANNWFDDVGVNEDAKNTIDNYIVQDKIVRINSNELENANRIQVSSTVSTNKNGFELRHSINMISSKIGMRYDRTRLMLERIFFRGKLFTKKFVDLSLIEFYAFAINNEDILKHDFQEAVSQKARQIKLKLDDLKIVDWKAPEMDYIKYDPKMKDPTIYEKSIYMMYPNNTIKSKSERMFEFFCEHNENIKWFYKNGESSNDYFSIVYVDAVNHKWHFYPDFIVCDKDNKIWIIETKGGENYVGESKNIDIKVENKFEALKEYAKKYNVNWGFVRDYDKNDSLYFCNTDYTEDMEDDNWVLLNNILGNEEYIG